MYRHCTQFKSNGTCLEFDKGVIVNEKLNSVLLMCAIIKLLVTLVT